MNKMSNYIYRKVSIVTHSYMSYDGLLRAIGGVETYVDGLVQLLQPICNEIVIIQPSYLAFEIEVRARVRVIGVSGYPQSSKHGNLKPFDGIITNSPLAQYYKKNLASNCDMTICTSLPWGRFCSGPRLIGIQHGISWDGFIASTNRLTNWIKKMHYEQVTIPYLRRQHLRDLFRFDKVICVDLNFPNWLRSTFPTHNWDDLLEYVPNFADPVEEPKIKAKLAQNKCNTVLIARRFEKIRGLPLMAEIVSDIYDAWPNIRFIFAGWGSQKEKMECILKEKERCEVICLSPEEILKANLEADIVVIPSLWSEGTSLSCIEGMCAGAAVLATSIGGLGNIILPGYNGLLVSPRRDDIREGLVTLLSDSALRKRLAWTGYETAKTVFSRMMWNNRIMKVLEKLW